MSLDVLEATVWPELLEIYSTVNGPKTVFQYVEIPDEPWTLFSK